MVVLGDRGIADDQAQQIQNSAAREGSAEDSNQIHQLDSSRTMGRQSTHKNQNVIFQQFCRHEAAF